MRRNGHFGWRLLCAALAMMLITASAALADIDLGKEGSVTVLIHTADGVTVENAQVELYQIGTPAIENYNLVYVPTEAFGGVDMSDLSDEGIAAAALTASENAAPYAAGVTDAEGRVSFSVPCGLYLVKQNGFAEKMYFSQISAFAVAMPMTNEAGDGWTYEITAQPKVNELPKPTPTPKPTDPPSDDKLPQTGMLRWPIPVLAVAGLMAFSAGWALCFMKKKKMDNGGDNA